MSNELLIRSPAADLYARALVMAYRSGVRIYDPSLAQAREPDIEAKLLRDADIAMAIKLRQHMIAGNDWYIEPATDDPVNQQAADVMQALCERIRGFTQSRHNLSRAFVSGQRFATMEGTELDLPILDGQPRTWNAVLRLRDHDKRRFRWVPNSDSGDGVGVTTHLEVLSTRTGDWIDVDHPEWLIKHTYDDSEEMLGYGRGLRESLYWWWYAKEHIFRESLQAAERFGQGILTAQIDGAKDANGMPNTELVTAWKSALEAMRSEHVLIFDKDDDVNVVNMSGTGWQMLSTMREELRTTIRTLILGASMTTNNEGGAGSEGLANVQSESTQSLVRYDRETLEETLTEDLIGYLWRANFHNLVEMGLGSAEMPRFKIKQEKAQDPERFARILGLALQSQIPLKAEEVYDGLGLSQPKEGDEIIEPPQQAPPGMDGMGGPPGAPGGEPGGPPGSGPDQDGGDSLVPDFEVPEMDFLPDMAAQQSAGGLTIFRGPKGKTWDESKHPRADDGKFGSGPGKGGGKRRQVDPTEGVGSEAGAHRPAPPLDSFPASVSTLTRKSGRKGSNPGGIYEDEDTGEEFYVKKPRSDAHAQNEVLAARLYDLAGIDVAEVETLDFEGQLGVASRWRKVEQRSSRTVAKAPGTAEGFAVDAWLMNWDAAGLGTDNLVLDPETGGAIRIDTGGALLYRAQGARKGIENLSAEVQELETMRARGSASKVFGKLSDEDILEGVERIIGIDDQDIRDTCESHYPEEAAFLGDLLIARKNWMRGWYEAEQFMRRALQAFDVGLEQSLTLFKLTPPASTWIIDRVKGGTDAGAGAGELAAAYGKEFGLSSIAARKRVNQAMAGLRAKAGELVKDNHGNAGQISAMLSSKGIPAGVAAGALATGFGLNPVEASSLAAYTYGVPGAPKELPAHAHAAKGKAPGTSLPDASKGPLKFAKAYLGQNPTASPEDVGKAFKSAGGGSPLGWATKQAAKVKQDLDIGGAGSPEQSTTAKVMDAIGAHSKASADNLAAKQAAKSPQEMMTSIAKASPNMSADQLANAFKKAGGVIPPGSTQADVDKLAQAISGEKKPAPKSKPSSAKPEQSSGEMTTGSSGQQHCPAGTEKGGQFAPKDGDCGAALTSKEQAQNVTKAQAAVGKAEAKLAGLQGKSAKLGKAANVAALEVGTKANVTAGVQSGQQQGEAEILKVSASGNGRLMKYPDGSTSWVHTDNLEHIAPPKKGGSEEEKAKAIEEAQGEVKNAKAALKAEEGLLGDVTALEQTEALGGFDPSSVLGVGTGGDTSFNDEAKKAQTKEELAKINAEAKAKREEFLAAKKEAKFVGTFNPPDAGGPPDNWPAWEYHPDHPGDKSKAVRGEGWNRGDHVRIKDQNGEFRDVRCVFAYGKKVKANGQPPSKALCIDPATGEKFSVTANGVVNWIKADDSKVATGKRTGAKKKMHAKKAEQIEAEKRAVEAANAADSDEGHFGGGASFVTETDTGAVDSRTALKQVLGDDAGVTARLAAVAQTLRAKSTDHELKGTKGIPMPALAKSNFTHKAALRTYTGGAYGGINGALRGRNSTGADNKTARDCVKGYEAGRTVFPGDGITVYRGSGTNGLARSLGIPLEGLSSDRAAAAMQVLSHRGARMKLDGMTSTSTHVNGSTSWGAGQTALIFEIDTPEGVPAGSFSKHPGEREVILAHGMEYSIKGVRWAPGISRWVVNLQAHPETRVKPEDMGPSYFKDKKAEFDAAAKSTVGS